jgi:uncharacterized protein YjbJ (UPF0337 family)
MNRDILHGSWMEFKGKAKKHWSELVNDDEGRKDGKATELQGYLEKKGGYSRKKVLEEINRYLKEIQQQRH